MLINDIEVTIDDLQNGYYIYQAAEEFRFGVDAVLLSEFARIRKGEAVLDMGTGTGIIPILLAAKTEGGHFYGLEIQKNSVDIANESVKYNSLQDRISIVEGDIRQASSLFAGKRIDVIVTNPPYMIANHGLKTKDEPRYIARHEVLCSFGDIAREASKILNNKGRMYLIHRPFRLAELITTLKKYSLEPKRIRFVHSYADAEPSMVMMEAVRGGNSGVKIDAPLIIYEADGEYTSELKKIFG